MNLHEDETRVVVITNPEIAVGQFFGGFVVGAAGTTRVGAVDVHPNELGPALAKTAVTINDGLEFIAPDNESLAAVVWGARGTLELRQGVFEREVAAIRQHPDIMVAHK